MRYKLPKIEKLSDNMEVALNFALKCSYFEETPYFHLS